LPAPGRMPIFSTNSRSRRGAVRRSANGRSAGWKLSVVAVPLDRNENVFDDKSREVDRCRAEADGQAVRSGPVSVLLGVGSGGHRCPVWDLRRLRALDKLPILQGDDSSPLPTKKLNVASPTRSQNSPHTTPSAFPASSNAPIAKSMSASVSAADICVRMRAWPFGTTGKKNPATNTPRSSSA
jgi:hypothetical protein